MATPISENAALMDNVDDKELDQDVPIEVDGFLRHVKRWKQVLGVTLLLTLTAEVWSVVEGVKVIAAGVEIGKRAVMAERMGDIAGMVIVVSIPYPSQAALMLVNLRHPVHDDHLSSHQKIFR
jgi:hypothetical protein